jgi:hypothetical protein
MKTGTEVHKKFSLSNESTTGSINLSPSIPPRVFVGGLAPKWTNPKIYLSGPMTGMPEYNFPAFNEAAAAIRGRGFDVVNPAELDAAEVGRKEWADYLRRDIAKLLECNSIAVLPGWENSKGAALEVHVAKSLGMPVFYAHNLEVVEGFENKKKQNVLEEAQSLVLGDRGNSYGPPKKDFSRTAQIWTAILGVPVEAAQVALCMIGVKISRQCNAQKRDNWTDIAGYALCGQMTDEDKEDYAVHQQG